MILVGGVAGSTEDLRAKWDARYRERDRIPSPALVLSENLHLLPGSGAALDLACGLGENALLLAGRAWQCAPGTCRRWRSSG
jgi:tellurite methyltransferase